MDDLRTPVGADMFDAYGKDPRVDTDAEVPLAEMAGGYETDANTARGQPKPKASAGT